jgi:hypothetical protein
MVQAPESILSPNLHVAVCRLLKQELQRGPAALESEWWMERCVCTVAAVIKAGEHHGIRTYHSAYISRVLFML